MQVGRARGPGSCQPFGASAGSRSRARCDQRHERARRHLDLAVGHEAHLGHRAAVADDPHEVGDRPVVADLGRHVPDGEVLGLRRHVGHAHHVGAQLAVGTAAQPGSDAVDEAARLLRGQHSTVSVSPKRSASCASGMTNERVMLRRMPATSKRVRSHRLAARLARATRASVPIHGRSMPATGGRSTSLSIAGTSPAGTGAAAATSGFSAHGPVSGSRHRPLTASASRPAAAVRSARPVSWVRVKVPCSRGPCGPRPRPAWSRDASRSAARPASLRRRPGRRRRWRAAGPVRRCTRRTSPA